eukprot:366205-Chlamydomonas_euryale.AAC.12
MHAAAKTPGIDRCSRRMPTSKYWTLANVPMHAAVKTLGMDTRSEHMPASSHWELMHVVHAALHFQRCRRTGLGA